MDKASERTFGGQTVVDVDALSPQSKRHEIVIPVPQAVQNSVTETVIALTRAFKVIAVYLTYPSVVPAASATAAIKIEHIAANGSTAVSIVDSVTILSGFTTQIPVALTLAATNPTTMAAGGSVMATVTTSNDTVTAPGAGGSLTFLVEPIEDAVIQVSQA